MSDSQSVRPAGGGGVAVIAVHGVGDQVPSATARSIARLLQRCGTDGASAPAGDDSAASGRNGDVTGRPLGQYGDFVEATLELPVVEWTAYRRSFGTAAAEHDRHVGARAFGADAWYVRSDFVKQGTVRDDESPDTAFTRRALETARIGVDQPELTHYSTVRYRGERMAGADAIGVDVYEMFWADLAKKDGGLARILGRFYQLLFHLSFLGVKTVEWAWARQGSEDLRRRMRTVLAMQAVVDALLGGVTPVMNLVLAATVLPVLSLYVAVPYRLLALALTVGVLVASVTFVGVRRAVDGGAGAATAPKGWLVSWPRAMALLLPVALGAAAALLVYAIIASSAQRDRFALGGLYSIAQVLAIALAVWLTGKLAARRAVAGNEDTHWYASVPWTSLTAAIAVAAPLLVVAWRFQPPADHQLSSHLLLAVSHAAEAFLVLVNAAWLSLMLAAALMCAAGWWCLRIVAPSDLATRRAIWTGKIGFTLSASLFSLVTLIAWTALVRIIRPTIPPDLGYIEWLSLFGGCGGDVTLACKIQLLDDTVGGAGYNLFLLVLLLTAAATTVIFLPSFMMEGSPVSDRDPARSAALGRWLDLGFVALRALGYLLLIALVVVVPVVGTLGAFCPEVFGAAFDRHGFWSSSLIAYAGAMVVAPLAILVSVRQNFFGGFQRAVNIGLDVDNWLSERPVERNPRGHILLRYLALLKYVETQGYQHIVFVTHSQGTVITADLLRFLATRATGILPRLTALPKLLMTAGSPLRQLYGLRFPHWYGWAREGVAAGDAPGDRASAPSQPLPSAHGLGVARWSNIYRSGDYVGRYLWWRERDARSPWEPLTVTASISDADDVCLERGAHTHYFDGSTAQVARLIDDLVAIELGPVVVP